MNLNKESYNTIAEQWAACRDTSFVSELVRELASTIPEGGKILDIGCGTGFPNAAYFSEQGFKLTGIDITEKLLQKALDRNLPNTQFYLCDFFDFEPKDRYDGVIAFDSFFHFPKEKQRLIYERVSRWMNAGAHLLFTHGREDGEIQGQMFGQPFYYSSLDKDEVCQLLSYAGLSVVWTKELYVERDMERDLVMLSRKV